MGAFIAIAVLVAAAPGGRFAPAPPPGTPLAASATALRVTAPFSGPAAPLPGERPIAGAPACVGEVCQPVVSVPGFEPRWRKGRNELALALLERADIQPISRLAAFVARSGVLLEFTPAALELGGPHGWGRLVVGYRWQLGAPRER